MIYPIKPNEVEVALKPDIVISVFNELIQKYWDGKQSTFKQDEVLEKLTKSWTPKEIFSRRYLDIESVYREAGWLVLYDKPAYNEDNYIPFFMFSILAE